MTKTHKDHLFSLVKSLTKSEKRQFKLYVGRLDVNSDSKFLNLFNLLDKSKTYNERDILKSGFIKKQQLANVKAHLYKQILISLKLNPSHHNVRSQIREQLDFASILYHKGLYKQSLKILDKAKGVAIINEEKNMAFEIVELEKVIESQYITHSVSTRADELAREAKQLSQENVITSRLSNLSLQLYSYILKSGYIKDEAESAKIKSFFESHLPEFDISKAGFREKFWYFKAHVWYSFLMQDFLSCYKFASKWVDLFHESEAMIQLNPVFFLKGNNYLLESLFFLQDKKRFDLHYQTFENTLASKSFPKDENVTTLSFLYLNFHKINAHFIDGSFSEGIYLIPKIEDALKAHNTYITEHHKMVFYYKFASLHFGAGNNKKTIFYLDKIISNKAIIIREDLLCFSRVLNLVAHYEAGIDYHLESLLKSTYKFLIKMNDLHKVQKEMIAFIRRLQDIYPHQLKSAFKDLHERLKAYEHHPYERRAFLYLDILSWLESKIENKSVQEIIQSKFEARQN
ncbi:hypothetical protein Q2T40_18195 [Winogradskyella maritima]|uniref:Tetratricopeptide repeat protein n=1 Tax=Winogradskyella maritima TaxID=1517766 RepID=A0ABV8AHX0_9FLAO|nr:hypothetical protein [Winogradskyella maritima]